MAVKYEILKHISTQLVDNIKIVGVFGVFGGQVLIVTNDDQVYSFGNCCFCSHGCLGLCKNSLNELTRVPELTGKQVANFSYGLNHVIAVTKCGDTYSWGNNEFGQLGNGTRVTNKKPKLVKRLRGKRVVDLCCGYYHSLALTQSGDVFTWGYNYWGQVGNGSNKDQLSPIQVRFGSNNKGAPIVAVAAGCDHSLALTESGHVYSWGSNKYGQLGIGENRITEWTPVLVGVTGLNIVGKKIICGQNHSLVLTLNGHVYAFGRNSGGQIGNGGYKEDQYLPTPVKCETRFADIAASIYCDISVGQSADGMCLVWGKCGDELITTPRDEPLIRSMHDAFCYYAEPKVTFRPINCDESSSIVSKTLNDQSSSDVSFRVDGRLVFAHKSILVIRSKYFRSLLSADEYRSSEPNGEPIELSNYSYSVYYAFFKYIYTYFIDLISLDELIQLYDLANRYAETVLKRKCDQKLVESITAHNACTLYSTAVFYESRVLEKHCLQFVSANLNAVCVTDDFYRMDDRLCKKLFADGANHGLFK